jgi:RHS repeat-associated protein
MLINTQQVVAAKYLYDPYGNIISMSGAMAEANLYRFSSKEAHANSGLILYEYRPYEPNFQRWVSRDPLGEKGHLTVRGQLVLSQRLEEANAYAFVNNAPTSAIDPSGLSYVSGGYPYWPPPIPPSKPFFPPMPKVPKPPACPKSDFEKCVDKCHIGFIIEFAACGIGYTMSAATCGILAPSGATPLCILIQSAILEKCLDKAADNHAKCLQKCIDTY